MPITLRDFLSFPFNNGRGIRADQVDVAAHETYDAAGLQTVIQVLRAGLAALPDGGQTAAQVQTAIRQALDALVGDEQVSIPVLAAGRTYTGSRGEDSVTATVVQVGSLLQNRYSIPVNLRTLAAGGESLTLLLTATHSVASVAGFNPDLDLVIQPYVAGSAFGNAHTVNIPLGQNLFPIAWQLPALFLTEGDPGGKNQALELDVTARVTIRGVRAIGSIVLNSAVIHGIGTHEVEFEELIQRLINADVNPIDSRLTTKTESLQQQITRALAGLLSEGDRRILALFNLVQEFSFVPYAIRARTGDSGAFAAAATTYTPTGTTVSFSLPTSAATELGNDLVLRQEDDDGAVQQYAFKGRVRETTQTTWIYQFTLPNTNEISIFRSIARDNLHVLQAVQHLIDRATRVDGYLTPAALALLQDVETAQTETTTVTRSSLLPALTVTRSTLPTQAPFATPAIDGGEWLLATRINKNRQAAGDPTALATLYLNDATQRPFIEEYPESNGTRYLRVARLVPATPAHSANSQIFLHLNTDVGQGTESYHVVLHGDPHAPVTDYEGIFVVPSGVTGDLHVSVEYYANGNQVDTHSFVATTTLQTYTNANAGGFNHWQTRLQQQTDGNLHIEFRPTNPAQLDYLTVVMRAWYVSTANIPATDESYAWEGLQSNLSFNNLTALIALKVIDGNLVIVDGNARRPQFDTGIPASRFGLQSGGTGVIRFSQNVYNEAIRVTAGDADDAMIRTTLRQQADHQAFGLGLFTNVTAENDVFEFDRAIKAPAVYAGEQHVGDALSRIKNYEADVTYTSGDIVLIPEAIDTQNLQHIEGVTFLQSVA